MKRLFGKLLVWVVTSVTVALVPTVVFGQTYTDLHDFNCSNEACNPSTGQLAQGRDGNLYGTLAYGGTIGLGTVFTFTPNGAITTLYNFAGNDGSVPNGGLTIGSDGDFYGVTHGGGANGLGTIFKITSSGTLTTLYSFTASDGGQPVAGPVMGKNERYYGLTTSGTAYSITSSGKFKLLTSSLPGFSYAPLFLANDGNFYGTTLNGGSGNGTVFRMTMSGALKVIYSFDGPHGSAPSAPVTQGSDGFLYGTTTAGGTAHDGGVVFRLSTRGAITVLHAFDSQDTSDGYDPIPGVVAATDGNVYGATSFGVFNALAQYGTLFTIARNGSYSVSYVFDQRHGANQYATAIQHTNGNLYGLAFLGGASDGGVFYRMAVGAQPFVSLFTAFGTAGQTVEILGNGLSGTTSVNFGTGSANFTVVSDTYMTAVVPANGTTGYVTVMSPSGTLISNRLFKVIPTIKGFTPPSGAVGTQVTIAGSGFVGATKVTFGGAKATSFAVNSGTQVTATVPPGAKTGKIVITTPGGNASSKATFTVTP